MNKLWTIIRREYLTRVKKKSFILATILTPIGIGLIAVLAGFFATNSFSDTKKVAIIDEGGIVTEEHLKSSSSFEYVFPSGSVEELKGSYTEQGYNVLVEIPLLESLDETSLEANFYSTEKLSLINLESIEDDLADAIKAYKVQHSGIDENKLAALEMRVTMENALSGTDGASDGSAGDKSSRLSIAIATGLSYIMGFLMYMVVFIYGSMVMRSVMEEKINRIVEVMISTVKPIQLMLGKIIGVGLVGLTQLAVWLILIPIIITLVSTVFGFDAGAGTNSETMDMVKEMEANQGAEFIPQLIAELKAMNWALIIPSFVVFFLGGFFIYSSLFAAVGSAMGDDLGEGQQMMIPITIPVIAGLIMIPSVFNDPDGPIAIFGSMFPLLSPILMPARLPFEPPVWQVLLSIIILLASIILVAWIAGRIYRIGILMYGKKVSFKEIGRWMFTK